MISIIDYGVGNIGSITKAFELNSKDIKVTNDIELIKNSDAIVLPGVSSFESAVNGLKKCGIFEPLKQVIVSGKPYFGICLGLQVLFESSEESPGVEGLNIFKGYVKKFDVDLPVPHIGWNRVKLSQTPPYFKGIEDSSYFYFVHSYYVVPEDKNIINSVTEYETEFVSSIYHNNIFAAQFHPEKSQVTGLHLIKNFCRHYEL